MLLPRGNGKTTLLAAIALHHLLTVERAEVYCAAASREQARILYEAAARFARELEHPHLVDRHLELRWCEDPGKPRIFTRHLRVLAADAPRLTGLTPSLAIVDELGEHPNDRVYLALLTALPKRAGSEADRHQHRRAGGRSPLGRLRARALAQPSVKRRGACTDARGASLRMLEWAVPDDVEPTAAGGRAREPGVVDHHRPICAAQREAVPDIAWRRYHAGQWTSRAGALVAARRLAGVRR